MHYIRYCFIWSYMWCFYYLQYFCITFLSCSLPILIYSELSIIPNVLLCHSSLSCLYPDSFLISLLVQNNDKKVNLNYSYSKLLISWLFYIFVCWLMFASLPKALFFRSGNSHHVLFMSSAVSWNRCFSCLRKQMKPFYTFNMFKVKHEKFPLSNSLEMRYLEHFFVLLYPIL